MVIIASDRMMSAHVCGIWWSKLKTMQRNFWSLAAVYKRFLALVLPEIIKAGLNYRKSDCRFVERNGGPMAEALHRLHRTEGAVFIHFIKVSGLYSEYG
jgi:hypothetical protein